MKTKAFSACVSVFVLAILFASAFGILGTARADAAAGTAPVTVVNTPLPIVDAQNPAKQPFNQTFSLDFGSGDIGRTVQFDTVPAGKRLVVEHASLESRFPADDLVSARLEYRGTTGYAVFQHLVIHAQGLDSSGDRVFAASEQLRAYIAAEESVSFNVARNSAGAAVIRAVTVTVSGYFVDVP